MSVNKRSRDLPLGRVTATEPKTMTNAPLFPDEHCNSMAEPAQRAKSVKMFASRAHNAYYIVLFLSRDLWPKIIHKQNVEKPTIVH